MPLRSELMIADADGSNPRKLVPGMEIDYNASFSHDGEWVVFTSDRSGSADIYRVRLDGRDLERLTDSPAFDDQAALSPDNRSLAFASSRGGSTDIYIMDLASREIRNLTNAPGGDFRPSWSPDGQTIAFSSDRDTGFPHQDYPGPAGGQMGARAGGRRLRDRHRRHGPAQAHDGPGDDGGIAEMVGGRQYDRVLRGARAGHRERALRRMAASGGVSVDGSGSLSAGASGSSRRCGSSGSSWSHAIGRAGCARCASCRSDPVRGVRR